MATIRRFEDIEAWQKARELAQEIYLLTEKGTFSKDYELKTQIRKSSGSIMDNIAEGFERGGKKEFKQFLSISKGSAGELRSQLYRALDRNHITTEKFEELKEKTLQISKMISRFISYLNRTDLNGIKFKTQID
jgi:four helix bundle protein